MTQEETIAAEIASRFQFLEGQVKVQRPRRLWMETPADRFEGVLEHLAGRAGFTVLCTITGQDDGDAFSITYHLARMEGVVLNLKVRVPKSAPRWKTIMKTFPGSVIYEREIADLLGVEFEGLPPGHRYPLPDDWPAGQYPLRKDWIMPEQNAGKKAP